jgi:hypothetical protein
MPSSILGDPRHLRQALPRLVILLALIYGLFAALSFRIFGGWSVELILRTTFVAVIVGFLVALCRKIRYTTPRTNIDWLRLAEGLLLIVGLPVLTWYTIGQVPEGTWKPLKDPPSRIVELVSSTPITLFGGDVYARGEDGRLYAHRCGYGECGWEEMKEPLPVIDTTSYWSGACGGKTESAKPRLLPIAPARIVSNYGTRYCGPDYADSYYFIATEDGRVWVWSAGDGFAEAVLAVVSTFGAFLAGMIVLITLQISDKRRESQKIKHGAIQ